MALTADIPLIKLANGEAWSVLLLRSGTTFVTLLLVWAVLRLLTGKAPALFAGRTGLIVAGLYGCSSVLFMLAVFHTTTANLVFILALNAMFSALLCWLFLNERPSNGTLLAMAVTVGAVVLIVQDGIGRGHAFGDLLGLASTFFIACAITVTRASRKDMGFAALGGVALPAAVAAAVVVGHGLEVENPGWIIFNGALVTPFAFFCLATGPRFLSGPEVSMFYLLETVFAPIWVWLIFREQPSWNVLMGGAILVATLVAHSIWQLHSARRRKVSLLSRHPA